MRWAPAVVVATATILAGHGRARAQGQVYLLVEGACPDHDRLAAAVQSEGVDVTDRQQARWRARVSESQGSSVLVLVASGRTVLWRKVQSDDCGAIAEAFALMIAARARQSRLAGAGPARPPRDPRVASAASGSAIPADGDLMPPALTVQQSVPASGARAFAVGLALGVEDGAGPDFRSTFSQLDVAWLRSAGWGMRGALAYDAPRRLGGYPGLLRRQAWGTLQVVRRWGEQRTWLAPAAGGALVVSSVSNGLEQLTRLHPALTGSLTAGYRVSSRLSVRAELGAQLVPVVDSYATSNSIYLASSPRAIVSLGLGVQVNTRSW